ncbi:amino acid ABC transporter substrate-binding protein [Mangrovitalea sediminis]|uniref:amino acid ABC transporter substrate-binding protein n=1 Tax=Mangrovitalea sediminis TaxID=1982043 RepID=UPI001177ACC9|nr:amino acid ABC transporter substrate-binding protein [Mangrovitalea sediminis]
MALAEVSGTYGIKEVRCSRYTMSRDRLFQELLKGDLVQVVAEAPKPHWEQKLIPIRIPIRKGIQGYRVFLIKRENESRMREVRTLDDLMAMPTGSGGQWSTASIMARAGFNVITGSNYEGLFRMLEQGRFTTFGRGINEAYSELKAHQGVFPDLMVDPSVMLYIPLPTYFFVTPKRPKLASQIEAGLRAMQKDGSFDRLFYAYFGKDIERARLRQRRIFFIPNPDLSAQTPFSDKKLWFDPQVDSRMLASLGTATQSISVSSQRQYCTYNSPLQ